MLGLYYPNNTGDSSGICKRSLLGEGPSISSNVYPWFINPLPLMRLHEGSNIKALQKRGFTNQGFTLPLAVCLQLSLMVVYVSAVTMRSK